MNDAEIILLRSGSEGHSGPMIHPLSSALVSGQAVGWVTGERLYQCNGTALSLKIVGRGIKLLPQKLPANLGLATFLLLKIMN